MQVMVFSTQRGLVQINEYIVNSLALDLNTSDLAVDVVLDEASSSAKD